MPIPQEYVTRRQSFYNDIQDIIGEKAGFIRFVDQKAHLLVYPKTETNFAIAQHLLSVRKDEDLVDNDELVPFQGNALIELVHSALCIRNDLENPRSQCCMVWAR